MECPKRGCDLGTCVVKRYRSKNAFRLFLRFRGFSLGQGLRSGPLRSKGAAFCVCVLKPTKIRENDNTEHQECGVDVLDIQRRANRVRRGGCHTVKQSLT